MECISLDKANQSGRLPGGDTSGVELCKLCERVGVSVLWSQFSGEVEKVYMRTSN